MEVWKDISNYEGIYQISNLGNVKSLRREVKHGSHSKVIKEKILKPAVNKYGYLSVHLHKEGKRETFKIHRLVALTFVPNPLSLLEVSHMDGIKSNNNSTNLEWTTRGENISHAIRLGLNTNPSIHRRRKVIRTQDNKTYNSIAEVCKELKVHHSNVVQSIREGCKCRGYNFKYLK